MTVENDVQYMFRGGYGAQTTGWGDAWAWTKTTNRSVGAGAISAQAILIYGGKVHYGPKVSNTDTIAANKAVESHVNLNKRGLFEMNARCSVRDPGTLKSSLFQIFSGSAKRLIGQKVCPINS